MHGTVGGELEDGRTHLATEVVVVLATGGLVARRILWQVDGDDVACGLEQTKVPVHGGETDPRDGDGGSIVYLMSRERPSCRI